MITVQLSSMHAVERSFRQTPGSRGIWQEARFEAWTSRDARPDDWLVVFDQPAPNCKTQVAKARRILMVTEPPDFRQYLPRYLAQFGTVISPYRPRGYTGHLVCSYPALPWWFGREKHPQSTTERPMGIEELRALPVPKPLGKPLSVVCSDKAFLAGQQRRLALVAAVEAAFSDRVERFGRGVRAVQDKCDAIYGYRYHLAIENNLIPNFWTEKFADSLLGYALPIVLGGTGLEKWFPTGSYFEIDPDNYQRAVRQIGELLQRDPYDEHLPAIQEARRRLMDEHNLFGLVTRTISQVVDRPHLAEPLASPVPILPNEARPVSRRLAEVLKRRMRAVWRST